jgi:hypothetical protein
MHAVQKTGQRTWPSAPVRPHPRGRSAVRAAAAMTRFPGRLNLFQKTMLDWRDQHPYVAVHAARLSQPLDAPLLKRAIDATLDDAGLTGLELDRHRGRYAWRGGPAASSLDVVETGPDWQQTLQRTFERQLNEPFAGDGRIDPFRFFAVAASHGFFLGLAYDHFIAGGDSIVVLLNSIANRYSGSATSAPLERYPRTHWRLFARHPWQSVRGIGRLPAMAASCRRTIRPRYRSLEDGYNAFSFFTLDPGEFVALRRAGKTWGVTLNDALIALLLLAQADRMPNRDRSKRRHELAVASIFNLRDAHHEDVRATFGQFLSSFRVSHPVPEGITLREVAQDVQRATSRIKREKLYLTTLGAIAVDRIVGRFRTREQRMGVYAKSYPVGAGVSSLNVNALWQPADGGSVPAYIRGVPTGPASPIAVAASTSGDTLCAGITYRTTAVGSADILELQAHIRKRIDTLK